jgi:ABC-type multidrug transport system ATPase subunit
MSSLRSGPAGAGPVLVVRTRQSDHRLQAGTDYRLGRDPASDIVLTDARVSWSHAVFRHEQDVWILEDTGSTNGTFVDARRVDRITISSECVIRLGDADDGPVLRCEPAAQPVHAPTQVSGPSAGMTTVLVDPPAPVHEDAAPVRDDLGTVRENPAPVRPPGGPGRIDQPVTPEVRPSVRDDRPPVRDDRPAARFTPRADPPAAPARPPAAPSAPPAGPPSGRSGPPAGGRSGPANGTGRPATPQVPDDYRLSVDRRPTAVLPLPTSRMRIGRTDDNELVLSDLSVSKHHAELRKTSDGKYQIADLGSHNGTFVNGQRVTSATLTEKDIVGIGHATFRLTDGELREYIDTGDVSLVAQDLVVEVSGGKILLDHVSFPLGERNLVGIIGPSGAGKSTLLGALTGMRPADRGVVLYDNRDLYKDYDELRTRIGLVPQDSVMHTQLTTQRALQYGAELRFPPDTGSDERTGRVEEVMGELGLTRHADTRADRLSGGQLKRVNVALELLTKPSLLFLDEPTSGLDPGLDKSVMEQMRDLAHDGRTVIVVTHSVANLNVCDRLLVLVPGGRVAFFGPPGEGLAYFGEPGWAEVFQTFDREPDRDWAAEFKGSRAHDEYVTRPQAMSAVSAGPKAAGTPAPVRGGAFSQIGTLVRRYTRVLASDRWYALFAALIPIIVGALIYALAGKQGLSGPLGSNANAQLLLILVIVGVCLSSTVGSIRELVKERNIYIRERAAGLSSAAYLGSKLIVLGLVSVVQAAIVGVIGLALRPLPAQGSVLKGAPFVELLIALVVFAVASTCVGLMVSALVSTTELAMMLLALVVFVQIILCGGVVAVGGVGVNQISWLIPGRWGYAAVASTANLNQLMPRGSNLANSLWQHSASTWLTDIGGMIVLSIVVVVIAWWRLNRLSPGRRK